jgi:hypothetical protein
MSILLGYRSRRIGFNFAFIMACSPIGLLLNPINAHSGNEPKVAHVDAGAGFAGEFTGTPDSEVTGQGTGVAIQINGLSWNDYGFSEGRAQAIGTYQNNAEDDLHRTLTGQSLVGTLDAAGTVGAMIREEGLSFCPGLYGETRLRGATSIDEPSNQIQTARTVVQADPALCFMTDRGVNEVLVRLSTSVGMQKNGALHVRPEEIMPILSSRLLITRRGLRAGAGFDFLPLDGSNRTTVELDANVFGNLYVGTKGTLEALDLNSSGPGPRREPVVSGVAVIGAAF